MNRDAQASAAARLDPDAGVIAGFALGAPGRIRIALDGVEMRRLLATAPVEALSDGVLKELGPPPTATCAFIARLPADADGTNLEVFAQAHKRETETLILHQRFLSAAERARYQEGSLMGDFVRISDLRFQAGVFRATVDADGAATPPAVALRIRGEEICAAEVSPSGVSGRFDLVARPPLAAFGDGVVSIEFVLADGDVAARYPIAAGAALAGDLASEVASLRVEMDQLKGAVRSALAGGVIRRDERAMIVAEALTQVDGLLETRDRAERAHQRAEATEWEDDAATWDIED